MPYKNAEDRRANDRERKRRERAGVVEAIEGTDKNVSASLPKHPTIANVTEAVAAEINRVRETRAEPLTRARTVGYLAGVLIKALEIGEIEERLVTLESAALLPERRGIKP